ncbi:hypothetical protein [Leptolyngbya sp. PCC 6406]|uniref:hypothetical protein n=1 Tax=Leptolyngbya sp. PCC 6406 TaxID=1173264 RepID=UPI0021F0CCA9
MSLADIYAALAYYYDHREAIQADIRAGERLVAEIQAQTPSKLQQKLQQQRGTVFGGKINNTPPGRRRLSQRRANRADW